jgi:DNA-nicking Smr family endonuclease
MKRPFQVADHGLWDDVARTVKPLSGSPRKKPAAPIPETPKHAARPALQAVAARTPKSSPPPISGFDRRTAQKLMRGNVEIDSSIDLHGTGIEAARGRLLHFLVTRRHHGDRTVLVITGKGDSPFARHTLHGAQHFHSPERQGRLRRHVPEWLHEPEFRAHVIGFQPAHPKHGGGGAFYVKLRRIREP